MLENIRKFNPITNMNDNIRDRNDKLSKAEIYQQKSNAIANKYKESMPDIPEINFDTDKHTLK